MTKETYFKAKDLMEEISLIKQRRERLFDLMGEFNDATMPKVFSFEGYTSKAVKVPIETARNIVRIVYDSMEEEYSRLLKEMEDL